MNRTNTEEYIFGSIILLANKFQIWGDTVIDDLTMKQWFLLILMSKMDTHTPTIKEIADFTGTSRQNVKKLLGHLEEKGYVEITKSNDDARALSVTLSNKAFDYFKVNEKRGADLICGLFSQISDEELTATSHTLEKLLAVFGNPPLEEMK